MKAINVIIITLLSGCAHVRYSSAEYMELTRQMCKKTGVAEFNPITGGVVCNKDNKE